VYSLYRFVSDPLKDIPGPFPARFTRLWYLFANYKGNFELTNINLHKMYGPIVRIAPNEYTIDNFEAAKTIYGHGNAFVKVNHLLFKHLVSFDSFYLLLVAMPCSRCNVVKKTDLVLGSTVRYLDTTTPSQLIWRQRPYSSQCSKAIVYLGVLHELSCKL
jgi:hypothetical protein